MSDDNDHSPGRPHTLNMLDDVEVGSAPIGSILSLGRAARRRRRGAITCVAAVTALLIGGLITSNLVGSDSVKDPQGAADTSDTPTAAAALHTLIVDVDFKPGGNRERYFEGAMEQVHLKRRTPTGPVQIQSETDFAPWQRSWTSLPSGTYTLFAAVRPCAGTCDISDPPTDRCEQTFNLRTDSTATVEFDLGSPCAVTVTTDEGTPRSLDVAVTAGPERTQFSPSAPGTAQWDPRSQTITYTLLSGYSISCPPSGTAEQTDARIEL